MNNKIIIETSARHIHLSRDFDSCRASDFKKR